MVIIHYTNNVAKDLLAKTKAANTEWLKHKNIALRKHFTAVAVPFVLAVGWSEPERATPFRSQIAIQYFLRAANKLVVSTK